MRAVVLLTLITTTPVPIGRVRAESSEIAAVIQDAGTRSVIFRGLLAKVETTDGLVYVGIGKCGHSVRACLSLSVKAAGPNRLLRIKVDSRQKDCELIEAVGHELRHAIEILSDPHVKDMHSAYSLFEHLGPTGSERFETPEALHIEEQVGQECRSNRAAKR
jgi:hypothetical protein